MSILETMQSIVKRLEHQKAGSTEYINYLIEYFLTNYWTEGSTANWLFPQLSTNQDTIENIIL
jgi:hypothetical protein